MRRYHPVVVVGCGHERRRVADSVLDIVERRIGVEILELLGIVTRSIFHTPAPADGELVEAQHVHDPHGREGDPIELRPLGYAGTDEQSAVGRPGDGQCRRRGVFFLDEIFGGGDEVVEDVLLLLQHPGLVPSVAVFTASPQIRHRVDAVVFEQDKVGDIKIGGGAGVEPAVGIEKRGPFSVELEALLVDDEHRDLRPILARIKDLLRLVIVGIEFDFCLAEDLGCSRRDIVLVDRRRVGEGREGVEGESVLFLAAEPSGRPERRERDFLLQVAC